MFDNDMNIYILDGPLQLRLQTFCKSKVFIYSEKMKIDCSKVPVAATLANLLPEESIDFHFVGVFR